ncbi:MAG: M16 family metallopeptidase [Candidatus Babeliales bacterium]
MHKHVLENGMTILVRPVKTAQKVSTQLWFNVGSKHEADSEKGLAHWLEHMCFKGTDNMSETDVRLTAAKLSGSFNAATSYDYTRYFLNFPSQHWFEALPMFADMMQNCTFKQDLLNAEVQVVIQEMKNHHDNFLRHLMMEMITALFPDHPYHYPIIGFKSDLQALSRDRLYAFYKKHYIPNNAVLVIVGNVEVNDVIERATATFGHMQPNWAYHQKEWSNHTDIETKNITLYRDVQKPTAIALFKIPGAKAGQPIAFEVLERILAGGRDSRLYKRLVDEEQLVTSISVHSFGLFDADTLWIIFEPHDAATIPTIHAIIWNELERLKIYGPTQNEVAWTVQKIQSSFFDMLESNHSQAETIGRLYLATGHDDALFNYFTSTITSIMHDIQQLVCNYLRPSIMHTGLLMPLPPEEHETWKQLQTQSNQEDAQLLQDKKRISPVEAPVYMHKVIAREPNVHDIAVPQEFMLDNGLKVLYYHNDNIPKVTINLQFKFDSWYEPKKAPGLCSILNAMLLEGTKTRSKKNLMEELERYGAGVTTGIGSFTMNVLTQNAAMSMELATDIIANPRFDTNNLEKIKQHVLAYYKKFWDNPDSILDYLIDKHMWQGQCPNTLGTPESIAAITPNMLHDFHAKYYSPQGATLVIVGDLNGLNLRKIVEHTFGKWQGLRVKDITYQTLPKHKPETILHPIEREQIMLAVCGPSIDRRHKDFHALALFNQVLNKKLFTLREQSNAFYGIAGSVISNVSKRPGYAVIKTQVSQTRAQEAQDMILHFIDHAADSFTEHDLYDAQNALINTINDQYSTNNSIASSFAFLHDYELPYDYYVTRIDELKKITVQEVRDAVKKVFNSKNMSVFKVGSVN